MTSLCKKTSGRGAWLPGWAAVSLLWIAAPAPAYGLEAGQDAQEIARYVLVVANNTADGSLKPLRYADDDGVLYHRLFSSFASRIELLAVLDDDTQHAHAGMAAVTLPPTGANLREALASMYESIERDRKGRQARTEFFFVYVGHGGVDDEGKGYLHLSDGKLTRASLFHEIIQASPADYTHLILDSCNAYSVVAGRGKPAAASPEEVSRVADFLSGHDLQDYPSVGVLLATSEDDEVHEWSRLKSGVFSHQLRSALSGAADVNMDGLIEYSEVAAFVDAASANLAKVNRRFKVFAWPPRQNRRLPLLDIRSAASARHVIIGEALSGKFAIQDEQGSSWVQFHKGAEQRIVLSLPTGRAYFLRNQHAEREIEPGNEPVTIDEPPKTPVPVGTRGVLDRAYDEGLFAVPFGRAYYLGYLSGRAHLMPVQFGSGSFLDTRVQAEDDTGNLWNLGYEIAYTLHPALFLDEGIEHGGAFRLCLRQTDLVEYTLGLEAGFADGPPGTGLGVMRIAVLPGVFLHWAPLPDRLDTYIGAELGYAVVDIMGSLGSTDYSVGVGRLRLGAGIHLGSDIWLRASAALAAHVITLDQTEKLRARPEFLLSVIF